MSLEVARNIAYSALAATQVRVSVTSANIANADTDGYTRKTATASASVQSGVGTGTTVTGITSSVDKLLLKSLVKADWLLGAAETTQSYADQLQSLFGSTTGSDSGGTSIASSITDLETAFSALAETPESSSLKAQAVDALDTVTSQLRELSSNIQDLRGSADQEIEDDVGQANDLLSTLDDLNDQITAAQARGESTADLEDQRNSALQSLAGLMDIAYYVNSDNQLRVTTASGTTLLDSSAHTISYTAASAVTADTVFGSITVDGKAIDDEIGSGSIGALLEQRDEALPAAQDELDTLAASLIDTLNDIANSATASPPPSSLTGTTQTSASDAFSGSGTVRIAVTDSDGNLVSYSDLDLSSYSTVGDLVDAINAIDGLAASIDSDGHLVLSADDSSNGVALADIDASIGTDGDGLSAYFGLNDILTGSDASTIRVASTVSASGDRLPTASLSTASSLTVGSSVIAEGTTGIADAYYSALTGNTTFPASGGLGATSTSFADYAAAIVSDAATAASKADTALTNRQTAQSTLTDSLSSATGVNLDEETATLTDLQNLYSMAAQLLSVVTEMFQTMLEAVKSS